MNKQNSISCRHKASAVFVGVWYAICAFTCIDTHCFLYLTLSQSLSSGLLILLLLSMAFCDSILRKENILISKWQIIPILWCSYMIAHHYLITEAELCRLIYLLTTISLVISMPYLLKQSILQPRQIENGMIIMVAIQNIYLLLQSCHFIGSYSPYFSISGCSDNPNATAMLLALSIPLLYQRQKRNQKLICWILITLSCVFLICLRCRTALIGVGISVFVLLVLSNGIQHSLKKLETSRKLVSVLIATLLLVVGFFVLYQSKADSSNGRLLIWKISSQMIMEHPQGCGIGMFEHDYNLKQGEYFASGNATDMEKKLSTTIFMANNDYIEHATEAGIPGIILMILFYCSMAKIAFSTHSKVIFSILIAFIIMSAINFGYVGIHFWIALLALSSIPISRSTDKHEKTAVVSSSLWPKSVCIFALLSFLMSKQLPYFFSQIELFNYINETKKGNNITIRQVESLEPWIGSSEAYWRFLSQVHIQNGDYDKAINCLEHAAIYLTSPNICLRLYDCYSNLGDSKKGLPYIEQIRQQLPQNLISRLILLKWYEQQNSQKEAVCMANEIVSIPIKIKTKESIRIQEYARSYLKNNDL